MEATNVHIQLIAEVMYNKICGLAFVLCCMMVNTMTHLDKFRIWKRHLYQLLPPYEEKSVLRIRFVKQAMCFAHHPKCLLQNCMRKSKKCAWDWKIMFLDEEQNLC